MRRADRFDRATDRIEPVRPSYILAGVVARTL